MRDWRAKLARRKKEGDGKHVTLFLVSVAITSLLLGVAIAVTHHGDSFLRRVPRSAVIYVHAEGSGLARLGAFLPASLAATKPSEVGTFAMINGSDELSWAWFLRWPGKHVPAGLACAASLDDGTCLITASQALLAKQSAALRNDTASLLMDKAVAKSLAAIRGMSLVQAYVQSEGFRDLASEGTILPGPSVMTWTASGVTTVWPVGSQVTIRTDRHEQPNLAEDAIMTIEGMNDLDTQAIMGIVLGERMKVTSRPMLAQLESIFARTSYFSLGHSTSDYLIHLRGVAKSRLFDNLTAYFSSLQPMERPLVMPDGQTAVELAIDVSDLDFVADSQGLWRLTSKTNKIAVPAIAISEDGKGGLWLVGGTYASKPPVIQGMGQGRQLCFRNSNDAEVNPLDEFILGTKSTCVVENVDKSVVIYRNLPQ